MLAAIKKYFVENLEQSADNDDSDYQLKIATAALLLEMASADFDVQESELSAVANSIQQYFCLSRDETDELLTLAAAEAEQSTSDYHFTKLINNGFSAEQKVKIIEHMWEVAYADDHLQKYEEALVRKISDLIYVPHSAFIAAKHRVKERNKG